MACTVFEGKGQRRSRSEEDLQSQLHQQQKQQTSSISYVPNNVIHPDHDHPDYHQYQRHHNNNPNILGDFVVSSSQHQQQLAPHPHENGNGNVNGNDSDDWLNDNFSDLELDAEIHEKPNSKFTRTVVTAQQGTGKGLNLNKTDADNSDTENNTENDNSISELDHDYKYEHDCDYDNDCDPDYTFDNDEKGFLEATKLHQVGYFNPDGMPYSHHSHGIYTMQDNNDTGGGGNVSSNSNDEAVLVENDCKNYSQQLAQLLRTGNGNGNRNSCTESSDEDIITKNAFQYGELMESQGGHDDQFQYGFKIDPTLDDDGCLEELDDPPFYTVMDAFHAYTMQKRVTEANQKWGTGSSGSNADKISSQTDLNPDSENKTHSNPLRKVKVQFSERVELYSVETPTDDDESDDNGGSRLNSSSESPKKTTANSSRVPVVHVKELRLEDESYRTYKIAQIKSKEVPETKENLTVPKFINTSNNNNFPKLYASADTDLIPNSRNLPVMSEAVSYKVSEAGFPVPVPVPLPVVSPVQNLPILPESEFEFHKALSSPSTLPSTVVGRAAESLSFNINVGQSAGQPMTLERHVASAPTLTKSKKLTKTKSSTKAQSATPAPGQGQGINNIKIHTKLKKKNHKSAGMSVTEAPISSAETQAHLQKEREFQAKLAETILALRKLDRAADSSFIGIGDQSIRRIYTPGSSSIQSSATASKSQSQEKLLPWKRTDSQSHGHGGSFTFTTASETYKLGNQNKNSSTFSSFPPPPPSQLPPHPCSDAETSIGLGPSKLNPILQSILDPKNLDLLTKCCNPNNPIFKELKAQILKHNVPKTFLQTRLNKKMINLLFDHPNHITQSHKHKDKEPNTNPNDTDSHKTNNISSKNNPTPTPTTVVNVSNLNFQKETLSSKSKNSVQISNLKNSKKFKHAGKSNDRRDKSKSNNCISASTSNNPFPAGHPPNTVNHNASHNTSASNTNTNAGNGSKWASRPELSRPTTLTISSSSSPPIRKQEETLNQNQNQSTRKSVRKRTPTPAPVKSKSQDQSHRAHRVLDVNSTIIKSKLMAQKEIEIRVRQPTSEKLIVDDHERKKSKLEMGFHALSLHNNCHAIIASTALANSTKPKRAPSYGLGLTITSPRTRNKYEVPSHVKSSSKNQIPTSNFTTTTLPGSMSDSGSRHQNPIILNRKVKCAS